MRPISSMTPSTHRQFARWPGLALLLLLLGMAASTASLAKNRDYVLPASIASSPFNCSLVTGTIYACPNGITLDDEDTVTSTESTLTLIVTGDVDIHKKAVVGSSTNPINIIASGQIKLNGDKNTAVYGNISAYTINIRKDAHVYGNCSSSICKGSCDKLYPGGADDHLIPAAKNCTTTSLLRGSRPTVETGAATDLSVSRATLNATVSSNGSPTTALFGYGITDGNYATTCGSTNLIGSAVDSTVSCPLSGLACNTTYYWRPLAFNALGLTYGPPRSTTSSACTPSVITGTTTGISATGATLNATVSSNGSATTASFGYSTTDGSYTTSCGSTNLISSAVDSAISCTLGNLTCNTTYYWRPTASNAVGSVNGNRTSFTTSACASASRFDAYEISISHSDAATPAKHVIHTRVANSGDLCKQGGTLCAIRIAAFDASSTVATTYSGDVSAQLEYCANVSRTTNSPPSCGGTWTALGNAKTVTLTNGIGTVTFTAIDNAYEIVRVSISSSTIKSGPWTSTDYFAIRPASLVISATDATSTAGTTRSLMIGDPARTGDFTHIAGKPFTLSVTSGKSRYAANQINAGTGKGPIVSTLTSTLANATIDGVLTLGTWASSGGTLASTTATYDEAGSFRLSLEDRDFTAIDTGDGSTTEERYFSGSAILGRFTPEKLLLSSPSITAANNSGTPFTYFGQDGFTGNFTLTPVNAATPARTTKNYPFTVPGLNLNAWTSAGLIAPDLPSGSILSASTVTPVFAWVSGIAGVSVKSQVNRPSALTAETTLTIKAKPIDSDGITTDDAVELGKAKLRFGRLRLLPAYGSDLLPLRIPVRAEYYTSNGWALNTDDSATTLSAGSLAIEPIVSDSSSLSFSMPPTGVSGSPSLSLTQGTTELVITPKTQGVGGAYIALNLGAGYSGATTGCRPNWDKTTVGGAVPSPSLMYLAGNTCGAAINMLAPAALVKFGAPKAPFSYLRERY